MITGKTIDDCIDIAASLGPQFNDATAALIDLSNSLYGAAFNFVETYSPTERAQCACTFAQALRELEKALTYLQGYHTRMVAGIPPAQGKITPLHSRKQPRDARGRFIKRAD